MLDEIEFWLEEVLDEVSSMLEEVPSMLDEMLDEMSSMLDEMLSMLDEMLDEIGFMLDEMPSRRLCSLHPRWAPGGAEPVGLQEKPFLTEFARRCGFAQS